MRRETGVISLGGLRFEWVSLELSQPVLLCECLQSMGAEILASLEHSPPESPATTSSAGSSTASSSSSGPSRYLSFRDIFPIARPTSPNSPTTNRPPNGSSIST